jgi:hypothetical protein
MPFDIDGNNGAPRYGGEFSQKVDDLIICEVVQKR